MCANRLGRRKRQPLVEQYVAMVVALEDFRKPQTGVRDPWKIRGEALYAPLTH
jgi:hypothetical protein